MSQASAPKSIPGDPLRQHMLWLAKLKLSTQPASISIVAPQTFDQGWTWYDSTQMHSDHMISVDASHNMRSACGEMYTGQSKGRERQSA